MIWCAAWPPLKRIIVGIESTPYCAAVCWFSSTLSLTTFRAPLRSLAISSSTGATTRHGPYHGAQKSTSTGVSASRTSAWKLLSVTSFTGPAIDAPFGFRGRVLLLAIQSVVPPEAGNQEHGLARDAPAHLRPAELPVAEDDRHLDDAKAPADRPIRQLDLEGIAPRADRFEPDGAQHVRAEALEAAGQIALSQPKHDRRVQRAAARDEAPQRAPVAHPAAVDVARAQRHVGAALAHRAEQSREVRGVVGEVRVHLEDVIGAALQGVPEARQVRRPEPLPHRAVQHRHRRQLDREPVGEVAGPIRRGVVDDQHPVAALAARALEHPAR